MSGKPTKAQAEVLRKLRDERLHLSCRLPDGRPCLWSARRAFRGEVREVTAIAIIETGWAEWFGTGITELGRAALAAYEKEHAHER